MKGDDYKVAYQAGKTQARAEFRLALHKLIAEVERYIGEPPNRKDAYGWGYQDGVKDVLEKLQALYESIPN